MTDKPTPAPAEALRADERIRYNIVNDVLDYLSRHSTCFIDYPQLMEYARTQLYKAVADKVQALAVAGTDTGTNKDGDSLWEAPGSASTAGAPAAASSVPSLAESESEWRIPFERLHAIKAKLPPNVTLDEEDIEMVLLAAALVLRAALRQAQGEGK